MIRVDGHLVTPTIFPDNTSQVWKLPNEVLSAEKNVIVWSFESEAEIVHLAQLKQLLDLQSKHIKLTIDYLPYARQDKSVSNTSTFALHTFATLLNAMNFNEVHIVDPHSSEAVKLINNAFALTPFHEIFRALEMVNGVSCFPDEGASLRYGGLKAQCGSVIFDKTRNQLTGEITGVATNHTIQGISYLIVDDICDGGRTFIEAAKELYKGGAKEVHLYVSHGIFSKGLKVLREAGIKRIFTYKGEIYNEQE